MAPVVISRIMATEKAYGQYGLLEKALSELRIFNLNWGRLAEPGFIDSLLELAYKGTVDMMSVEFARFVSRIHLLQGRHGEAMEDVNSSVGEVETVGLCAFLAADAISRSHSCLLLRPMALLSALEAAGAGELLSAFPMLSPLYREEGLVDGPALRSGHIRAIASALLERMKKALFQSPAVGKPGQLRPLVFDGSRLYIHRYWSYERRVARAFLSLASTGPAFSGSVQAIEAKDPVLEICERLFFRDEGSRPDWQKLAALRALHSRLVVVSGGPGTGKTRTVTAIMALVQAVCLKKSGPVPIALCAPTGKAAARLTQSVNTAVSSMDLPPQIKKVLPNEASTLHRLLGAGRVPGRFKYDRKNPLPYKLVIVDEASMVDLPLFVHLIDALSEDCSMILLGDKDQLASVEAGCVLRDLCLGLELYDYSDDFIRMAERSGESVGDNKRMHQEEKGQDFESPDQRALRDCLVVLKHNYRFRKGSGLSELAHAINKGNVEETMDILSSPEFPDVSFVNGMEKSLDRLIKELSEQWFLGLVSARGPSEALSLLNEFKVLCALRQSATGADNLNRFMDRLACKACKGSMPGNLFKGKAIVINRNDYQAGLYNGDTGICWPDGNGSMAVWFEEASGGSRRLSPGRLPSFDTAWAMTVHRSQGSEFSTVLVVLPPATSPMAGRELLYTAVTRARKRVILWGAPEEIEACIRQKTVRHSGLGRLLWEKTSDSFN